MPTAAIQIKTKDLGVVVGRTEREWLWKRIVTYDGNKKGVSEER